jgi:hypothetical protein
MKMPGCGPKLDGNGVNYDVKRISKLPEPDEQRVEIEIVCDFDRMYRLNKGGGPGLASTWQQRAGERARDEAVNGRRQLSC